MKEDSAKDNDKDAKKDEEWKDSNEKKTPNKDTPKKDEKVEFYIWVIPCQRDCLSDTKKIDFARIFLGVSIDYKKLLDNHSLGFNQILILLFSIFLWEVENRGFARVNFCTFQNWIAPSVFRFETSYIPSFSSLITYFLGFFFNFKNLEK